MTQDTTSNNQLIDNLFKAIDTIATKRLEQVKFNKTLTCQIVDTTNKDKGMYVVSDGVVEFLAYSENSTYSEGTWVYVTVPNGDFDEQKIIVGKYVSDNTEYATYQNPLNTYLDITGNLIENAETTYGLVANNKDTSEIVIWRTGQLVLTPYDSSQASAEERIEQINRQLNNLHDQYTQALSILKSVYGGDETDPVYLEKRQQLEEKVQEKEEDLMAQKEALNLVYQGASRTTKQLSNFDRLGIQAKFKTFLGDYNIDFGQYGLRLDVVTVDTTTTSTRNNYEYHSLVLDTEAMFGNPYNFLSWSKQQVVFDISDFNNIVGMQLVFYQANDFVNDENQLIPGYPSLEVDSSDENKLQWQAYCAMNNILVSDIFISLGYDLNNFQDDAVMLFTFNPLTYTSYLTPEVKEQLREKYPTFTFNTEEENTIALNELNQKNLQIRWIHYDPESDSVSAIDDPEDIDTWEWYEGEELILKPLNVVHWYHLNLTDGIKDDLAGAFWEEITWPEDTQLTNHFEYNNFIPNILSKEEKIKVIIESPSREYLRNKYEETVDNYVNTNEASWKQTVIAELFPDGYDADNIAHIELIENALDSKKAVEKDNYLAACLAECKLYESAELTFTNEQEVANQTNLDLIEGLKLIVDNDPNYGLHGTYCIYNPDGQIINYNDAARTRIISASFNTLVSGNEEVDDSIQTIRWYIPTKQTMIEYPSLGCEYDVLPEELTTPVTLSEEDLNNLTTEEQQIKLNTLEAARQAAIESYRLENPTVVESAAETADKQWFCIERQGAYSSQERQPGDIVPTSVEQIFRIKSYFTQTAINNTVRCEVYKNNKTYKAECTLIFGTSGSNGTDYTFTTTLEQEVIQTLENNETQTIWVPLTTPAIDWHGGRYKLVPHVYNYNNIDVTEQYRSFFTYELYAGPSVDNVAEAGLSISESLEVDEKNNLIITCRNNVENKAYFLHYIVKVTAENAIEVKNENDEEQNTIPPLKIGLTTYVPLAIRFDDTYIGMDGDNRITYDSSGTNPIYYKDLYTLYYLDNNKPVQVDTKKINWKIVLGEIDESNNNYRAVARFYPRITNAGRLIAPSLYISDNSPQVSIIATVTREDNFEDIVWCQPLYISQQVYDSAFLNSWDGSLVIDNGNGIAMATMMGAGFKDTNNTFNGVLMGQVTHTINNISSTETGLFGYLGGVQSFGFRTDGTAFLGRANSTGQILFDGTDGYIQSRGFKTNDNGAVIAGLKLDLVTGAIYATSGTIGGWRISNTGLKSDEIGGVILHSPLGDTDEIPDPLRISVGKLDVEEHYYIASGEEGQIQSNDQPIYGMHPVLGVSMITGYIVGPIDVESSDEEQIVVIDPITEEEVETVDVTSNEDFIERTVEYEEIDLGDDLTNFNEYSNLIRTHLGYAEFTMRSTNETVFQVSRKGFLQANLCRFPTATINNLTVTTLNGQAYKYQATTVVTSCYKTNGKLRVIRRTLKYLGLPSVSYSDKYYKNI